MGEKFRPDAPRWQQASDAQRLAAPAGASSRVCPDPVEIRIADEAVPDALKARFAGKTVFVRNGTELELPDEFPEKESHND